MCLKFKLCMTVTYLNNYDRDRNNFSDVCFKVDNCPVPFLYKHTHTHTRARARARATLFAFSRILVTRAL